jgi:hypothetical protein
VTAVPGYDNLWSDLRRWQDACARIRVGGRLPVRFTVITTPEAGWLELRAEVDVSGHAIGLAVQDREDAGSTNLTVRRWVRADAERVDQHLLDLAVYCYVHELKEQWVAYGARPLDPHAPGGSSTYAPPTGLSREVREPPV